MIEIALFVAGIVLLLSTMKELALTKARIDKTDRLLTQLSKEAKNR